MFENDRYITSGISEEIDESLQIALWNFIDLLKKKQDFTIDYLQVFELRKINNADIFNQEVIHSQEVETYKKAYIFTATSPVNAKIFAIDDFKQSVLMLAKEY